ncbi:rod outer segment membrane protein 1-like [Ostrinia furnacalis]|uniref:rod outer segment membrane protein 1-like n=1 Tax=Ostrinia furnacalis TaxID=93504 RepID=UPI001039EF00|nr:rod outer segment membrane protein 1-like [Ostrinia furnacalis]
MAWGVFAFSKDGRQQLAAVLRGLLIAQLVVSLCMVIFCYNTSLRVMLLLKHVHKLTVYLLYGLILLQAYCMKLHYTSGLRLITLLLQCPHWSRATLASRIWLASGTIVAFNGMLVYGACRGTLTALMKELSSSLRIGISQYLTEPTWKRLMDTMQVELSCCGVEKPSDWHEIPWINMDFLNEDSDLVMRLAGADGKVLPPVSPYSCCTPRVLAACYHDPLQQSECREIWRDSPLLPASLHARGCVEAVRGPLTKALLALHCFNTLVLLLQLVIMVLTQLLRTSARAAVLRGDGSGPGRAYLLGDLRDYTANKDDCLDPIECGGANAARAASICCVRHAHTRARPARRHARSHAQLRASARASDKCLRRHEEF